MHKVLNWLDKLKKSFSISCKKFKVFSNQLGMLCIKKLIGFSTFSAIMKFMGDARRDKNESDTELIGYILKVSAKDFRTAAKLKRK